MELNPKYVGKATDLYVEKKGKDLRLQLQQASYRISYQMSGDGLYYPHYTRGELKLRCRLKKTLFSSRLNFDFEMVTCDVDTSSARPIPRTKRLVPGKIFAETVHPYDADFWQGFNIILPEEKLRQLILNRLSEVAIEDGPE